MPLVHCLYQTGPYYVRAVRICSDTASCISQSVQGNQNQFPVRIERETCAGRRGMFQKRFSSIVKKHRRRNLRWRRHTHSYIAIKKDTLVVFGPLPLPNGFILCESYGDVLQYGVLHLTVGTGQSKSIPSKNTMRNMRWRERDVSEKILINF